MAYTIEEVDKVEILTLQDNFIDMVTQDNSDVIQRAVPLKGMEISNSILAEHGFSALVTITCDGNARSLLFDFGFSEDGATRNAEALNANIQAVEVLALSHGHLDHVGGIKKFMELTGKSSLDLVLHPWSFVNPRFLKITEEFKVYFPAFTKEKATECGVNVIETEDPYRLIDGQALFLGQIPRVTTYEKGAPDLCCEVEGKEMADPFHDDTGLAFNVKGKGLVVLSGCAHSGIVNTVKHAQQVTGIDAVYAVMGGFHLSGTDFDTVIKPTTDDLKSFEPDWIVPTHCTGREVAIYIEKEMPDQFILNMSGTQLTFAA